ncbi:MAG: sulfotransferase family 2 domain-containing protein [Pseudomonadota bacterium]
MRTPYHHPDVPFIFLWAHKAGCTVLLRWYLFQAHLLLEASSYEKAKLSMRLHRYEKEVFKARPNYMEDLLAAIAANKPIVAFIRCPFQRAYSAYLQINNPKLMRLQARGDSNNVLTLRRRILDDVHGSSSPLDARLRFLTYLEWLKAQNPGSLNRHHRPQISSLYRQCDVNTFRLEQLASIAKRMEEELNLRRSHKHPKMFKTKHSVPKIEADADALSAILEGGVPMSRGKRHPVPAVNRALLEGRPEGALIADIFAEDLALYDSTPLL